MGHRINSQTNLYFCKILSPETDADSPLPANHRSHDPSQTNSLAQSKTRSLSKQENASAVGQSENAHTASIAQSGNVARLHSAIKQDIAHAENVSRPNPAWVSLAQSRSNQRTIHFDDSANLSYGSYEF